MNKISTKEFIRKINLLKLKEVFKKILIVSESKILYKSANNLKKIEVQKLSCLNIEKIINADAMIISKSDIKKIEGMVK
jgi:large subunit ribosomal protein L4